jgi:hypothetical protein
LQLLGTQALPLPRTARICRRQVWRRVSSPWAQLHLRTTHKSGFSCTLSMKRLPTGTQASRRRYSTSTVSTLKYRLYGSNEKKPTRAVPGLAMGGETGTLEKSGGGAELPGAWGKLAAVGCTQSTCKRRGRGGNTPVVVGPMLPLAGWKAPRLCSARGKTGGVSVNSNVALLAPDLGTRAAVPVALRKDSLLAVLGMRPVPLVRTSFRRGGTKVFLFLFLLDDAGRQARHERWQDLLIICQAAGLAPVRDEAHIHAILCLS